MKNYQLFLLGLLLIMEAFLSGQLFNELIGGQQAIAKLDNHVYLTYWQSLDKIMHVRMPIITNLAIFIFIINLLTLVRCRKTWPYLAMIISFVCLVTATLLEVKLQVPVNMQIQALNPNDLLADTSKLRAETFTHIKLRGLIMFTSFILLVIGMFKIIVKKA